MEPSLGQRFTTAREGWIAGALAAGAGNLGAEAQNQRGTRAAHRSVPPASPHVVAACAADTKMMRFPGTQAGSDSRSDHRVVRDGEEVAPFDE